MYKRNSEQHSGLYDLTLLYNNAVKMTLTRQLNMEEVLSLNSKQPVCQIRAGTYQKQAI